MQRGDTFVSSDSAPARVSSGSANNNKKKIIMMIIIIIIIIIACLFLFPNGPTLWKLQGIVFIAIILHNVYASNTSWPGVLCK